MKNNIVNNVLILLSVMMLTSCVTVKQGEVGVKRKLGTFSDEGYTQGLKVYNPFISRIIKVSSQTENLEVGLNIPSKEGLNIFSEVSILYRVNPQEVPKLLRTVGVDYESNIILPVFRSAVADVSANYFAKDMHTGQRSNIEDAIEERMMTYLKPRGIKIESVLLKSIQLPQSLANAIEDKLEAEQNAQRMQFVLQEEEREAERKKIEASGIRDAQLIISEGLDEKILQFKSIEAFDNFSKSNNARIIISDGDMPIILNDN